VTPRDLPSVSQVLENLRPALVNEIRRILDDARGQILQGASPAEPIATAIEHAALDLLRPSLRSVVNATGVVLHTNLGRAPLDDGYTNLEYDLATGKRGNRDTHTSRLLEALLNKPAIVVNNNAAALFLVLNELAAGGEAIVSRGELIEIGDGFRIPEIMERSGAQLREVGTTSRTHLADYADAITDRTRVLLRVHPSNFRMTGFTARPGLRELVALGRERNIPVYEDLGSGCVVDLGLGEPLAQDSLAAGASLISFSGDKLLGGPQAGIIAGDPELVRRVRRNPLFRALRQDKLVYRALESTLRKIVLGQLDDIPAMRMIRMTPDAIRQRAERLAAQIPGATVEPGESVVGGGSTPDIRLATWLVVLEKGEPDDDRKLRAHNPPIVARCENNKILIDLRTVLPEEEPALLDSLSRRA
jgi:L-seryl-tRNA(Ser) seleniumtransferase